MRNLIILLSLCIAWSVVQASHTTLKRVYQPITTAGTDFGPELIITQTAVVLLCGTVPVEGLEAVAFPNKPTHFENGKFSVWQDINAASLSGLKILLSEIQYSPGIYEVALVLSDLKVPKRLNIEPRLLVKATIKCIKRTVESWLGKGPAVTELRIKIIANKGEESKWKEYEEIFLVGATPQSR